MTDTPKAPTLILSHDRVALFHGDSALLDLPENSVDAIVCDPPAAISFMGRGWDDDRGGYDGWTRWLAAVLAPAVRTLRPGGAALLWALPRTSHWTARAVELAGLEIRDVHHDVISADEILQDFLAMLDEQQRVALAQVMECVGPNAVYYQAFGSGFPKSLDISKAIDAAAGAERPVIGERKKLESYGPNDVYGKGPDHGGVQTITAAATAAAARWSGYGTALKPAVEHWILARKPLVGTYADNVLTHGTGALNIDACRIGTADTRAPSSGTFLGVMNDDAFKPEAGRIAGSASGRWPAHLSLRHAPGCELTGTTVEQVAAYENANETRRDGDESTNFAMGRQVAGAPSEVSRDLYRCAPGCPVAELDSQSGSSSTRPGKGPRGQRGSSVALSMRTTGQEHHDAGGASRFFLTTPPRAPETPFRYVAKPSRREKDAGLGHLTASTGGEATDREDGSAGLQSPRAGAGRTGGAKNPHPTCKGIELMKWLIRLVVPDPATLGRPGVVLDPFAGSGSTGVAALALGHDFIGSELTDDYVPALIGRIRHALGLPPDEPE